MQDTVEKVPDSEIHACKALQPLHLHLQIPEPSLWVHGCLDGVEAGCFLWVTGVECVQLWCQRHSRLGLDALRRIPHYFSVKIREAFPLTLLSYSWPKSEVHIMMMHSGTFHPSLEIAEELLVADQLAHVCFAVTPQIRWGGRWSSLTPRHCCHWGWLIPCCWGWTVHYRLHGIPNCLKTSRKVPWRQSDTGTEPLGW